MPTHNIFTYIAMHKYCCWQYLEQPSQEIILGAHRPICGKRKCDLFILSIHKEK